MQLYDKVAERSGFVVYRKLLEGFRNAEHCSLRSASATGLWISLAVTDALQSKARLRLRLIKPPVPDHTPQRSPSSPRLTGAAFFVSSRVASSIVGRRWAPSLCRCPRSTKRFHDPRHIIRIGLRRAHACAAAVPVDRHRVRPAAAAEHSASVPSHSLRADRRADSRGRPAIGCQSGAHPVQPCVVAGHLRHRRAGAGGVHRQSEVAGWPVLGWLARLQRTIFINRQARHQTGAATREIAARLLGGDVVVLFAEGTSSDGIRVLPFRSSLVGAVHHALGNTTHHTHVTVQPMSLAYVGFGGVPMGRACASAWHGTVMSNWSASAWRTGVRSRRRHRELGRGHSV